MSKQATSELVESLRTQYLLADRLKKGELLDLLVESTGRNRKYAIQLLHAEPKIQGNKARTVRYDETFKAALIVIWEASNKLCSKRLVPYIPEFVRILERCGHLNLNESTRHLLFQVSPATVDRLLKPVRKVTHSSLSFTKPGNLLKKQIPVRTFTEWDDAVPGFFEADLVSHSGPDASGQFLQTLTLTDICTQWTECFALLRRGELEVRMALQEREERLPFPFKGLDTDNGFEFINWNMLSWCQIRQITFTRGRPYKKNDQAHVEERNASVVRKLVGYDRLEGRTAHRLLTEFYDVVRLYQNFFQPSQKLLYKHRDGAKVYKKHDAARTPYQRVLESPLIQQGLKDALTQQYVKLDPVKLLAKMRQMQAQLREIAIPVASRRRSTKRRIEKANLREILEITFPKGEKVTVRQLVDSLPAGCTFQAIDLLPYNVSRTAVDQHLTKMVKTNKLIKVGWGVYRKHGEEKNVLPLGQKINEATVSL